MASDKYLIENFSHLPHTIPGATEADAGVMTAAQVQKLNGASGATFTKAVITTPVALTDAPTVRLDASLGNLFTLSLGGDRTLANFTNRVDGQSIAIRVQQTAGNNVLAYGNAFKFPGGSQPVLSTGAGAIDILTFLDLDGVIYFISIVANEQ